MLEAATQFASIVGVLVGLGGLGFGLRQYAAAQKWKRSELAREIIEQLRHEPRLALACQLLDYSVRRMAVPDDFAHLAEDETFVHDWRALERGLKVETEVASFSWQETLYRDVFDELFDYLGRVNHDIRIGLIDVRDVEALDYWLQQLRTPRFTDKPVFTEFIKAYGYDGASN